MSVTTFLYPTTSQINYYCLFPFTTEWPNRPSAKLDCWESVVSAQLRSMVSSRAKTIHKCFLLLGIISIKNIRIVRSHWWKEENHRVRRGHSKYSVSPSKFNLPFLIFSPFSLTNSSTVGSFPSFVNSLNQPRWSAIRCLFIQCC